MRRSAPRERGTTRQLVVRSALPTGARSTGFEATRRDLLSLMGFSLGAAGLGGCRAPVQHADPAAGRVDRDDARRARTTTRPPAAAAPPPAACWSSSATAGRSRSKATTRRRCSAAAPARPARPRVLSLYDDARLRGPVWHGQPGVVARDRPAHRGRCWRAARADRRDVVLLSQTITSPSTRALLDELRGALPELPARRLRRRVAGGAARGEPAAVRRGGRAALPVRPRARRSSALEADFLGTWLSPVEFARQYARGGGPPTDATRALPRPVRIGHVGDRQQRRPARSPSRRRSSARSRWRCSPPSPAGVGDAGLAGCRRARPSRRRTRRSSTRSPTRCGAAAANRWWCAGSDDVADADRGRAS